MYDDILNADVLINVPIAKQHSSSRLTLAMKNLMGVVWNRSTLHMNLGQCIADLNSPHPAAIDGCGCNPDFDSQRSNRRSILGRCQKSWTPSGRQSGCCGRGTVTLPPSLGLKPEDLAYIVAGTAMGLGRSDLVNMKIEQISLDLRACAEQGYMATGSSAGSTPTISTGSTEGKPTQKTSRWASIVCWTAIAGGVCIGLLIFSFMAVQIWPVIGAQGADVLRSIIGDQAVAGLEMKVNQVQDELQKLKYQLGLDRPARVFGHASKPATVFNSYAALRSHNHPYSGTPNPRSLAASHNSGRRQYPSAHYSANTLRLAAQQT